MLFSVAPAVFAVTYACVRGFVLNERYAIYISLLLLLLLVLLFLQCFDTVVWVI